MSLALAGKTVALAEGRQLEELKALLEKEGAIPFCCPLLSILDSPDAEPVNAWIDELIAGKLDVVILLTGEGLRRLMGFAQRADNREAVIAALGKTRIITRGPKPVQALKEVGLKPARVATAPTTSGVINCLQEEDLAGKTVGVQLYSEANVPLQDFLTQARAIVRPVQPYVYAPSADADRVVDLIHRTASGAIDVLVFTSSPQIERIYEVAAERQLDAVWRQGLHRVKIASVGPVVTETLRNKGVNVDIQPEQGFQMKNLVVHIGRAIAKG
ncbi:uroporphyrinogen-III synthase [Zavarzinella formosa]|uniref:uroporphyrinogen-III synthase n=1 Tax=Zavarzinella formosa TaxID=360055 RepID=UPI00036B4E31|nr:uroporphyrinogen-III synthase [Zavarzinella formosa]